MFTLELLRSQKEIPTSLPVQDSLALADFYFLNRELSNDCSNLEVGMA
jgi:hypothetical protein